VPAAVLAAKYQSEAHQIRRAMRLVEAAWLAQPHPDLADAYAHVKLGDSARQRLVRVETLASKAPGHLESRLAIARAAIDATEFAKAREALAPFVDAPTQRVAMLMAEIERTEHGDSGKARAWTLRAVRALHDPVWTADGYVSDRWRPVSPVTGRLDAFQWQTPLAALPSDKTVTVESTAFNDAMLTPPKTVQKPAEPPPADEEPSAPQPAAQDNSPVATLPVMEATVVAAPVAAEPAAVSPTTPSPVAAPSPVTAPAPAAAEMPPAPPPAAPVMAAAPPPLFRPRPDLARSPPSNPPVILPIIRAPDDPGIDEDLLGDEFAERMGPASQAGGWRGFLARWGG
jgi:HemY protein